MNRRELESVLREHWPPQNVVLRCSICEEEIHNTLKHSPRETQPPELSSVLSIKAAKHRGETDHQSFDIGIDKKPSVTREIDVTVTVNEQ